MDEFTESVAVSAPERPALTTPFSDYSVTEGLLLLLCLFVFLSWLARLLKGGIFMAALVAEFFDIIGVDFIPPSTLAELIPYLLTVFVGVALVSAVCSITHAKRVNW